LRLRLARHLLLLDLLGRAASEAGQNSPPIYRPWPKRAAPGKAPPTNQVVSVVGTGLAPINPVKTAGIDPYSPPVRYITLHMTLAKNRYPLFGIMRWARS